LRTVDLVDEDIVHAKAAFTKINSPGVENNMVDLAISIRQGDIDEPRPILHVLVGGFI